MNAIPESTGVRPDARWRWALVFGLPIAALILTAITYWFAVADRAIIFLYNHDMGPLIPDTSPFSRVTASRYWMASLVACGGVMVVYVGINALLGIISRDYRAQDWRRVWVISALLLLVGIPTITMTVNHPTLPLWNALQVTMAALVGLAAALIPGELAATKPTRLLGLAWDGWSMALVLFWLGALELTIARWRDGSTTFLILWLAMLAAGLGWLAVMTLFRWWLRRPPPTVTEMTLAAASVTYLLLPLVHHLSVGFGEGYFYISDSDNFFGRTVWFQLISWLAVLGLIAGVTGLRRWLAVNRPPHDPA